MAGSAAVDAMEGTMMMRRVPVAAGYIGKIEFRIDSSRAMKGIRSSSRLMLFQPPAAG